MGKYYEGEEKVKTEEELLEDLINRKLVYEDEIDRAKKIITIGSKVINFGVDENLELDQNVDLEDDAGKEELIAEITPLGPLTSEDGFPEEYVGKYYAIGPVQQYKYEYNEDGFPEKSTELANNNFEIDWGDGKKETITNEILANNFEPGLMLHFYDTPNTYEIKITGECGSIILDEYAIAFNTKIKQWGTTGLTSIYAIQYKYEIPKPTKNSFKDLECVTFAKCYMTNLPDYLFANCFKMKKFNLTFYQCGNLREIPGNIFANCINAETFNETFAECSQLNKIGDSLFAQCYNAKEFSATFGETAITEIPETLFKNNTNAKSFFGTFARCTELTGVPLTLFDNCKEVEIFKGTFNECEKITNKVPELWLRGDNSEANNYEGENPNGRGCYGGCINIEGYLDIPENWRSLSYS